MMFRRFLVNACLICFIALTCLLVANPASAQLLTGYNDSDIESALAPRERIDVPDDPPVRTASISEYQPLLTQSDPVGGYVREESVEPLSPVFVEPTDSQSSSEITDTYSNFLTSPVNSKEGGDPEKEPLDIEADTMRFDNNARMASAQGNVIIVQDGRILRADEAQYFIDKDTVRASGNVVLNEVNGDIHLAQDVEYSSKLKNGTVEDLRTVLVDGSRFSAETGRREDGKRTIMESATYTACDACKKNPEKSPPWEIVASEVKHDEEDARISYWNARFNVYGVPVAYTPYFSHPDGTIERKSGVLAPSFGYKSDLGAFVENSYYWNIAQDKDATFGINAYTEQAPLGLVEYRQRWQDASLIINGGLTYSDRTDQENNTNVLQNDEVRGHVFAEGLWDIDEKWRSGLDIEYVSDEQYARQYDITNDDVLQNTLYAERFDGRDYATGLVQLYQDIRVSDLERDQPGVLPELYASFIGDPGQVPLIGGRWDASAGLLSLFRDGGNQDVVRASADLGWERRLISDYGLVSDIDLTLRGDAFYVNDSDSTTTTSGRESNSIESRFFPQIHAETSYPMVRNFERAQVVIEPLVALTAAPDIKSNDDIPNEDSQDVQIDASNLFEPNRFPGLDVVEDQSRVTYGFRTGINGYEQSDAEVFIGQSYRIDQGNNPFQNGSGLSTQSSDIVGYLKGDYKDRYAAQYRFQLDNHNLASKRHELDASADWNRFRLSTNYLYAQALDGTEITENREQIGAYAQYYLNDKWLMRVGSQYDFGASDPGLRRASIGLDYFGQCVSWSLTGVKNLTNDSSGDSDTEVLFRLGLRNIGEFMRTGLRNEGNSP